jgi:hypothetical protein
MARAAKRKRAKNPGTTTTRRVQNRHYKKVVITNSTIREAWDKSKTLQQNYRNLGLMNALNGGITQRHVQEAAQAWDADQYDESENKKDVTFPQIETKSKTDLVAKLEQESESVKKQRHYSEQEIMFYDECIAKHGNNYTRMSRDLKLNVNQMTRHQLETRIEKYLERLQE